MLNKIYLALLAITVLIMSFFIFYSYSWLQSIGSPEIVAENFSFYSSVGLSFLWISFLALVIFANIMIWKNGISISIWLAFFYFAVFMTLKTIWLAPAFLSFRQANSLTESSFSITPLIGALTIIVVAIAIFFDQFIVFRLREKISGDKKEDIELTEE